MFTSMLIVPYKLKNKWSNCLFLISKMSFMVSPLYCEEYHCTDKVVALDLDINYR